MQLVLFDVYILYQSLYQKYVPFTWKKIFENSKSIDLWQCNVSSTLNENWMMTRIYFIVVLIMIFYNYFDYESN